MKSRLTNTVLATIYLVLGFLLLTEIFTPFQTLSSRGELESFNAKIAQYEDGLKIVFSPEDSKKLCESFWISDDFLSSVPKDIQLQFLAEPGYSKSEVACVKIYEVFDGRESYLILDEAKKYKDYSRYFFYAVGIVFLFASLFYFRKVLKQSD